MARRLGVKLIWVEEVGLPVIAEGLRQQRFDLVMLPLWRSAERAKAMGFSVPIFYSTVGVYVRAGDSRFDANRAAINDPKVTVAAIDGEMAGEIARSDFPLAKINSLPQLTDYSQLMMQVASRKADITFFSSVQARRFIKQNPGAIKDITGNAPIRVYAECLILPIGDGSFRSMIDATLTEMIENGAIDKAFARNGEDPNEYYRPAFPFRNPTAVR
jgi:ABC-type amino acid transport substrate-binding protein